MTASDLLREWALNALALIEHFDAECVSLTLKDGTVMEYEAGDGLTVLAGGRTLEVPESVLLEEKWEVVA
jgi:hypothetical protein